MSSIVQRDVDFLVGSTCTRRDDAIAVEEPLEIRISGETLAITMRTPGNDRELVLGFLLAEGIITQASDISSIAHCAKTGSDERENTIEVTLAPGVRAPIDLETGQLARRGTIVSSACGVCGRQSIDDLLARVSPLPGTTIEHGRISEAITHLSKHQPTFEATGGCHAASLVRFDGTHVATFEDVGRHNAVDKVVGSQVRAGALPLSDHMLVVSGRSSFEIVQKAVAARIPVVVSVSAASSLAIDLARRANLMLCGFARADRLTIYAAAAR